MDNEVVEYRIKRTLDKLENFLKSNAMTMSELVSIKQK